MKTTRIITFACTAAVAFGAITLSAQSKEQREAAKEHPFTLRVAQGKTEAKNLKDPESKGGGKSQTETTEKTMHWTAQVAGKSTNVTEKVELKVHYVGLHDGAFAIIDSSTLPVEFNEKGRAQVEITSPAVRLTKKTVRKGRSTEKTTEGDRINGIVVQLLADGTIVKTFVSQPAWAKGAWEPDLSEEHLKPGARK